MALADIAVAFGVVGPLTALASYQISAYLLRRKLRMWQWAAGCVTAYALLLLGVLFVVHSRLAVGPCMFGCLLGGGLARTAALRAPDSGPTTAALDQPPAGGP